MHNCKTNPKLKAYSVKNYLTDLNMQSCSMWRFFKSHPDIALVAIGSVFFSPAKKETEFENTALYMNKHTQTSVCTPCSSHHPLSRHLHTQTQKEDLEHSGTDCLGKLWEPTSFRILKTQQDMDLITLAQSPAWLRERGWGLVSSRGHIQLKLFNNFMSSSSSCFVPHSWNISVAPCTYPQLFYIGKISGIATKDVSGN